MLKKLLTDTWSFFKDNAIAISLIVLPITAPIKILGVIFQNFIATDGSSLYKYLFPGLVSYLTFPIYSVAIIFYIASTISGEKIDKHTLWRLGVKFWIPYIILSTLVGISVFFGFVLLIVPGIILSIRFSFARFDLLLNQSKPIDAINNSWSASKYYAGMLFRGYLVLAAALYGPGILLAILMTHQLGRSSFSYHVIEIALGLIYDVLGVMFTIFSFHVYSLSRAHQTASNE